MSSSLSLPFHSAQRIGATSFNELYSSPGFIQPASASSGELSGLSGTIPTSPSTPLDRSLLSPAPITYGLGSTPYNPVTPDSSAYVQLARQYQQLERDFLKERQDHESLKISFQKLLDSNNMLAAAATDSTKRPRSDDLATLAFPDRSITDTSLPSLPPLLRSDFPLVKFWTRQDWEDHESRRKDCSTLTRNGGTRGPGRYSKGVNVRTCYIEKEDGTPICGETAGKLRLLSRQIWVELYERGNAPGTWGQVSLAASNKYIWEMESRWPILRYCEDHWKVHALATQNYSQWYRWYNEKRTREKSMGRASKRVKSRIEGNANRTSEHLGSESQADPGELNRSRLQTPSEDLRDEEPEPSEPEEEVIQEVSRSRPKARPLRDPLARMFNRPNATPFRVLDKVPDVIAPTVSHDNLERGVRAQTSEDLDQVMEDVRANMASPSRTAPDPREICESSITGALTPAEESAPPITAPPPPPVAAPSGPSPPPVAAPPTPPIAAPPPPPVAAPPTPPVAAPPTPPIAAPPPPPATSPPLSDRIQDPGRVNDGPTELEIALAAPDLSPEFRKYLQKKKFQRAKKVEPGNAITARRFCADDWRARYPDGTEGQFNYFWDTLDEESAKRYKAKEKAEKAKAAAQRKTASK